MLAVRWQREPMSGAGAALNGARWNRRGVPALYLSVDHGTAIAEFHQALLRPGTLAAYDIRSERIVDLTDAGRRASFGIPDAVLFAPRKTIVEIEHRDAPGWIIADRLIAGEADGILVPSAACAGVNLVLWRWSADGGDGAAVRLIDPDGDLRR